MYVTRASVVERLSAMAWDGEIRTNQDALAEAGHDFGHLVNHRPAVVLRAGSARDVSAVLRLAARLGVAVAPRGRGHSTFGQCQVPDGVVIDMRGLVAIGPIEGNQVTVGAGASWRSVLTASLPHGLTPPVLTDYLDLSVGGTLSVGGIGGTSHRHGLQTDHVEGLDVVTGDGQIQSCSRHHQPALFSAVLGGLGQHGIITTVTLRLTPAPTTVYRAKLYYPTISALIDDQRTLLRSGRIDFLQGEVLPGETGWRYLLHAASYGPAASNWQLWSGLHDDRAAVEIEQLSYLEFADRLATGEAYLRSTGEWFHPHPWWNAFLPGSTAPRFLAELTAELTTDDLGPSGLVLVYPIFTAPLTTPLVRVPDESVVFLVSLLRTSTPHTPAARRAVAANRYWYDGARRLGGTMYPVGAIPFDTADWAHHFGDRWPAFAEAKDRYDPHRILCPGQGCFASSNHGVG